MHISDIIDGIIQREGGYVNNPKDPGGATCWGITQSTARANGYNGDMRNLPRQTAYAIYLKQYWLAPGFDKIPSPLIAEELADTGVNMGVSTAGKFLQRTLNALVDARLVVDGKVGPTTLAVMNDFITRRGKLGETALLKMLNSLQCVRYIELAEQRAANREFIFGWVNNRVAL